MRPTPRKRITLRKLTLEKLDGRTTLDSTAPYVTAFDTPDSQLATVVVFSEPVVNVDVNDFKLLRHGVLLDSAGLSLQTISDSSVRLMLPQLLDSDYQLILDAAVSDIEDLTGNRIETDASVQWIVDNELPSWNLDYAPTPVPARALYRVAALGDSMTLESTGSYVQFLRQSFSSQAFEATTFAGSGWKVDTIRAVWETEVRDAGFDSIIVFAGLPNLTSTNANADEIFTELRTIYDDAIARGIEVVSVGICPWADYRKWTAQKQTETDRLNTLMRDYALAHPEFLHFVETQVTFGMSDEPHRLSPRYGIGDGVHFSAVGDRRLADLVTPQIAALMSRDWIQQTAWLRFNEPVSGLTAAHVQLTSQQSQQNFQLSAVSDELYRVDFNVSSNRVNDLNLDLNLAVGAVVDTANNPVVAQAAQQLISDYQPPSVTITADQPAVSVVPTSNINITFDENVTGVELANFVLLNDRQPVDLAGSSLLTLDARNYQLQLPTFAAIDGNFELIYVPSGTVTDASGNTSVRGAAWNWVVLPTAPQVSDNILQLTATRGIDTIELLATPDNIEWVIGGVPLSFANAGINKVVVHAGAGEDYVSMRVLPTSPAIQLEAESLDGLDIAFLYDSIENDNLNAGPTLASLLAPQFQISARGFAEVNAYSRSGVDSAVLDDSSGDDQMDGRGWVSSLKGSGFINTAFGFATVTGRAVNGGTNVADFFDSAADDVAYVDPTQATMTVPGYSYNAQNFGRVNLRATTGNDQATLAGGIGTEAYVGQAASSFWSGTGFTRYLYSFDSVAVSSGGGNDRATLYDSPADDLLEANSRMATLQMPGVTLTTIDFPRTNVYARGGNDTTLFQGRSISETFVGQPTFASLAAGNFIVYAYAFERVIAESGGGNDMATFFDSAGDDLYESSANGAKLSGASYSLEVNGYRKQTAYARTGYDLASMSGSAAAETLTGQSTFVSLVGPANSNFAYGFDRAEAVGDAGDIANLFDTGGNDTLEASGGIVRLFGSTYSNQAASFGRVNAFARAGIDTAVFTGTSAAETFTGRQAGSSLIGAGFANYAYTFDRVTARSAGGADVANLYDSAGDEQLVGTPGSTTLTGNSYQLVVEQFSRVNAYASVGHDTASLSGSSGNDIYIGRPDYSSLKGSQYLVLASGFDSVATEGAGGSDTASFYDSAGDDVANVATRRASLSGASYMNSVNGFNKITYFASSGFDTAVLTDSATDDTFTGDGTVAKLQSNGFNAALNSFDRVTLQASTGGTDLVLLNALTYELVVGLGWL